MIAITKLRDDLFELVTDFKKFTIAVPQELQELTPGQYWLLSHQITVMCQKFGLNNGDIIPIEETSDYKFRGDRKVKNIKVSREYRASEILEMAYWLSTYKADWIEYSDDSIYPRDYADFVKKEFRKDWPERMYVFLTICLLQNINVKNVKETKLEAIA